jgi:hypothetical protein
MRKARRRLLWSGALVLFAVASVLAYRRGRERWELPPVVLTITRAEMLRTDEPGTWYLWCDFVVASVPEARPATTDLGRLASNVRFVLFRGGHKVAEQDGSQFVGRKHDGGRAGYLVWTVNGKHWPEVDDNAKTASCQFELTIDVAPGDDSALELQVVAGVPRGQRTEHLESPRVPVRRVEKTDPPITLTLVAARAKPVEPREHYVVRGDKAAARRPCWVYCDIVIDNPSGKAVPTHWTALPTGHLDLVLRRDGQDLPVRPLDPLQWLMHSSRSFLASTDGPFRLEAGPTTKTLEFPLDLPPGDNARLEAQIKGTLPGIVYHRTLVSERVAVQWDKP